MAKICAGVAQLAERELPKLEVMGSTPTARSTLKKLKSLSPLQDKIDAGFLFFGALCKRNAINQRCNALILFNNYLA